jgi:hypothetical protein
VGEVVVVRPRDGAAGIDLDRLRPAPSANALMRTAKKNPAGSSLIRLP